jgi:hypothetical protein
MKPKPGKTIHMIKTGKTVTQNGMVEAYCQVMLYDKNATHIKNDVTCKKCSSLSGKKK